MAAWLAREERHTLVVWLTPGGSTTPRQRRIITDWIRENRIELARYRSAVAVVTASKSVRRAARAAYRLAPPPYEVAVFDDLEPARRWLRRQHAKAA